MHFNGHKNVKTHIFLRSAAIFLTFFTFDGRGCMLERLLLEWLLDWKKLAKRTLEADRRGGRRRPRDLVWPLYYARFLAEL